ncbi:MAG: hypothetical protein AAFY60_21075, partial [Myxococcota bacterium]
MLLSEYMRAMLEGGMLLPHWGEWIVDRERLEHIELSSGVLQLVRQRVENLDSEAMVILRAAAVLGTHFDLGLLRRISDSNDEQLNWAIAEALRSRLLERESGGTYAFIHQQVRDAFLDEIDAATERRLNRIAADALREQGREDDPSVVYALARHDFLGDGPELYTSSAAAGQHALESYAFEDAHGYLSQALSVDAKRADGDRQLQIAIGLAAGRTGRTQESVTHLRRAIEMTDDPVARADLHAMIAQVHFWDSFHTGAAWAEVEQGLAALGQRFARSRVGRVFRALLAWIRGYLVEKTGLGYGTATGAARERMVVLSRLLKIAGHVNYWTMKPSEMVLVLLRMLHPANRLG